MISCCVLGNGVAMLIGLLAGEGTERLIFPRNLLGIAHMWDVMNDGKL